MLIDILKSYLIGICAAAPLGPIAILVLQKTLHYGHRGGFTSALGSTLVDTTYAIMRRYHPDGRGLFHGHA